MKILAIADRQSRTNILELINNNNIDLFCSLGDLEYFSLQELQQVNHIPKIGIYGNHCSGQYFEPLGITNLHLRTFEYLGLTFGGFEGSIRYKESNYAKMYTQNEATQLLENFPYVDVLISHSPPYGINDEPDSQTHQGFVALRKYIEEKQPRYFLHGHTYPSEEEIVEEYLKTKIIYIYQDQILNL